MSKENNIAQWLRSWLNGDQHSADALRDAAQEDTFLRDAMEGYEHFPEGDHEASLERLRDKLTQRTQGAKRRTIVWYLPRIAAAASILLIGTWIIQQNLQPQPPEIAATAIETEDANDSLLLPTPLEEETESVVEADLPPEKKEADPSLPLNYSTKPNERQLAQLEAAAKRKESNSQRAKEKAKQSVPEKADIAVTQSPARATKPSPPAVSAKPKISTYDAESTIAYSEDSPSVEEEVVASAPSIEIKENKDQDSSGKASGQTSPAADIATTDGVSIARKVRGLITDENGDPLIGASIIEPGTNNGTMTDFDGQFDLQVQSGTEQLEIAYTGYETQLIPLEGRSFVEIQMEEGLTLDEVVVTDYRVPLRKADKTSSVVTRQSKKKQSKDKFVKANKAFKKYVKKNQRYPEAAKSNDIKGKVIIEFDIDPAGRPSNFRTIKSLGYGCDEEGIRLLKAGPDWSSDKGREGRFEFTF